MTAAREDTFRVSLTIDGESWGVWDSKSGGKVGSNSSSYPPGGMGPTIALGGTATLDTITLRRLYIYERDHDNITRLFAKAGKSRCVVKQMPLDHDGNAYGNPITWNGLLISVDPPSHDSTSSNAAMVEVVIQPDGHVSAN